MDNRQYIYIFPLFCLLILFFFLIPDKGGFIIHDLGKLHILGAFEEQPPSKFGGVDEMLSEHNQARSSVGQHELGYSHKLQYSAQLKADYMAENDCFNHFCGGDWSRGIREVHNFRAVGENLAKGFTSNPEAFTGLMDSPTHKANILNEGFYYIGVARATASDGTVYIVIHYASF